MTCKEMYRVHATKPSTMQIPECMWIAWNGNHVQFITSNWKKERVNVRRILGNHSCVTSKRLIINLVSYSKKMSGIQFRFQFHPIPNTPQTILFWDFRIQGIPVDGMGTLFLLTARRRSSFPAIGSRKRLKSEQIKINSSLEWNKF